MVSKGGLCERPCTRGQENRSRNGCYNCRASMIRLALGYAVKAEPRIDKQLLVTCEIVNLNVSLFEHLVAPCRETPINPSHATTSWVRSLLSSSVSEKTTNLSRQDYTPLCNFQVTLQSYAPTEASIFMALAEENRDIESEITPGHD